MVILGCSHTSSFHHSCRDKERKSFLSVSLNPTLALFIFFSTVYISLDFHVPQNTHHHQQQTTQNSLFITSHHHPQSNTFSHVSLQSANSSRAQILHAYTTLPDLTLSHLTRQPRPLKNQYLSTTQPLHSNLNNQSHINKSGLPKWSSGRMTRMHTFWEPLSEH